jgi:hypothetical protein
VTDQVQNIAFKLGNMPLELLNFGGIGLYPY